MQLRVGDLAAFDLLRRVRDWSLLLELVVPRSDAQAAETVADYVVGADYVAERAHRLACQTAESALVAPESAAVALVAVAMLPVEQGNFAFAAVRLVVVERETFGQKHLLPSKEQRVKVK